MANTRRPNRRPSSKPSPPTARCGCGCSGRKACTWTARSSRAMDRVSGRGPRVSDLAWRKRLYDRYALQRCTPRKATHRRPQATQLDREGLTVGSRKRCTIGTTLTRWHTPFKPTLGGRQRRRWTRGGMTQLQQAFERAGHIVFLIGLAPDEPVQNILAEELLKLESDCLASEQQHWIAHDCPNRIDRLDRLTMRHI